MAHDVVVEAVDEALHFLGRAAPVALEGHGVGGASADEPRLVGEERPDDAKTQHR